MSSLDNYIEKIQEETSLSAIEIGKKIEQKKQKVGKGYLTDEGALFLIANDYGITVSSVKDKEKEVEKTSKPKQSIEKQNQSISKLDLDRKFTAIKGIKNNSSRHNRIGGLLILFALVFVIITSVFQPNFIPIEYQIIGLIIVPVVISILILKRAGKYSTTQQQSFFFDLYRIHEDIQTFLDLKTDQTKDKAIESIREFGHQMHFWSHYGPVVFDDTPFKIYREIYEKVIPIVDDKQIPEIKSFHSFLLKLIMGIETKGYSKELFVDFKNDLDSLPKPDKVTKIKKSPSTFQKFPQLKFIWIPPIIGIGLFFLFNSLDESQIHASLGYSLTISSGLLIAIIARIKKKSFEHEGLNH